MSPGDVNGRGRATTERLGAYDVTMRYRTRTGRAVEALNDFNFSLRDHEFVSIVGPSGCGKSTALRLFSHLIRPTSGEVRVDGRRIDRVPDSIGLMFQNDTLLPWSTAERNIALGLEMRRYPRGKRGERISQLISLVGLGGFADAYPDHLSGGMRKRVALAQLLAYDPDIYLMDEPFAALDAQTRIVVETRFLEIWNELRKSVLFITHDIEEAIALSDRVIVMTSRPGRIKAEFDIALRRPRDFYEIRFEEDFRRLQVEIWGCLRDEVQ